VSVVAPLCIYSILRLPEIRQQPQLALV
jgi:hypothetical protein